MRRRDPKAIAMMFDCDVADVDRMIAKSMGASPDEDLAPIAALIGLCPDGSDPTEEVERLTRALHAAADRLGCADYDDVCAAVADSLDDAEKREREHVDEANALRMERERLREENVRLLNIMGSISAQLCDATRELDAARAALRDVAPRCGVCGALAACFGSYEGERESYACNNCCGHGNEDGHCVALSTEHADAPHAAGGVR